MEANTKRNYINTNDFIGKYVIVRKTGQGVQFLANNDVCDRNWTNVMWKAKVYLDLTAAEIKVGNLRCEYHQIDASVKVVTDGLILKRYKEEGLWKIRAIRTKKNLYVLDVDVLKWQQNSHHRRHSYARNAKRMECRSIQNT